MQFGREERRQEGKKGRSQKEGRRLEIKARVSVWKRGEKGGEERLHFGRDVGRESKRGRTTGFRDEGREGKGRKITGCSLEGKEEGRRGRKAGVRRREERLEIKR